MKYAFLTENLINCYVVYNVKSVLRMYIGIQGRREPNVGPGQFKCDGIPVLWTPKQMETMPQFCPNNDVISKKKVFAEILTVFSVKIKWSSKKRSEGLTCWFLSVIPMGPLLGPLKPMGPGIIVSPLPCPPSRWPCRNLLKGMSLSDLFVKAYCYLILFWSPAIKPLRFKTFFWLFWLLKWPK